MSHHETPERQADWFLVASAQCATCGRFFGYAKKGPKPDECKDCSPWWVEVEAEGEGRRFVYLEDAACILRTSGRYLLGMPSGERLRVKRLTQDQRRAFAEVAVPVGE